MEKSGPSLGKVLIFAAVLILAFLFLQSISWLIKLLLFSMLIVYILQPLADWLKQRFRLRKVFVTAIVFVVFLLFCAMVVSLIIPVIYYEGADLIDKYPHYESKVQEYLSWISQQTIKLDIEEEVRGFLISLTENMHQAVEYIAEASISIISGTIDFFLVLFLVFYLLYDFESIRERAIEIIPTRYRKLGEEILAIIDLNVGTFIRGSLVRCTFVGIATGVVLAIIGMPYAFLLGLLAGIFNFILYIGPYIAAIPALLLSLSPLTPSPPVVLLVYVLIQIVDGMIIAPLVLGRIVQLKAVTIIVVILAGGHLAGILGMLFAVPVAGIVKGIIDLAIQKSYLYDSDSIDLQAK